MKNVPRRKISNTLIFSIVQCLLFISFFATLMKIQHDSLLINGRKHQAIVTGNVLIREPSPFSNIISYRFNDNGTWFTQREAVEGTIHGIKVGDLKRGDKIEVLFYNGESLIKGYHEQRFRAGILFFMAFSVLLIWVFFRRFILHKKILSQ